MALDDPTSTVELHRPLAPRGLAISALFARSDRKFDDFTGDFSDHVPVAVRFIIGEDDDRNVWYAQRREGKSGDEESPSPKRWTIR